MDSPPDDGGYGAGYHFSSSLSNQPPQVFGSFSIDGSPSTRNLGTPIFADDVTALLGEDGLDHGGDPKRRRIARACDMCRKKKIKVGGYKSILLHSTTKYISLGTHPEAGGCRRLVLGG